MRKTKKKLAVGTLLLALTVTALPMRGSAEELSEQAKANRSLRSSYSSWFKENSIAKSYYDVFFENNIEYAKTYPQADLYSPSARTVDLTSDYFLPESDYDDYSASTIWGDIVSTATGQSSRFACQRDENGNYSFDTWDFGQIGLTTDGKTLQLPDGKYKFEVYPKFGNESYYTPSQPVYSVEAEGSNVTREKARPDQTKPIYFVNGNYGVDNISRITYTLYDSLGKRLGYSTDRTNADYLDSTYLTDSIGFDLSDLMLENENLVNVMNSCSSMKEFLDKVAYKRHPYRYIEWVLDLDGEKALDDFFAENPNPTDAQVQALMKQQFTERYNNIYSGARGIVVVPNNFTKDWNGGHFSNLYGYYYDFTEKDALDAWARDVDSLDGWHWEYFREGTGDIYDREGNFKQHEMVSMYDCGGWQLMGSSGSSGLDLVEAIVSLPANPYDYTIDRSGVTTFTVRGLSPAASGEVSIQVPIAVGGRKPTLTGPEKFSYNGASYEWTTRTEDGARVLYKNGVCDSNEFVCDGLYTYYCQADGTVMKDRLTYHPDGTHVIYFDANGHEVFNSFAHASRGIGGEAIEEGAQYYFNTYGYMYINTVTYDVSGTKLYYINPYGQVEHTGWFAFDENTAYGDSGNRWTLTGTRTGFAQYDGNLLRDSATYYNGRQVYMQANGEAIYW